MKNIIIFEILNDMAEELTVFQLKKLQEVLLKRFDEEEKQPNPLKMKSIWKCSSMPNELRDVLREH